ncbi:MAG: tyrosine-type recombinase/integrase, partial [Haloechinothrix sp.]
IMVWRSVRQHGDTKTKNSRRSLKLPPMSVKVLRQHRRRQGEDRKAAGRNWKEQNLVFASTVGTPLDPSHVRRDFRNALKNAKGIYPYAWTPRELRHTFVSLMSAHGVSLEEIARLVGHSSTAVTELVYRKELRPVITEGAEVMDEIFRGGAA